jgi:hypothetical protein
MWRSDKQDQTCHLPGKLRDCRNLLERCGVPAWYWGWYAYLIDSVLAPCLSHFNFIAVSVPRCPRYSLLYYQFLTNISCWVLTAVTVRSTALWAVKPWAFTELHGITTQKIVLFTVLIRGSCYSFMQLDTIMFTEYHVTPHIDRTHNTTDCHHSKIHHITQETEYQFTKDGWGTVLQAGRSRVRFPIMSLDFSINLILPAAL